ncbi:MAG: alanine--tRNA ligase [Anaerolineae bacterium]|nr:alanine--tRNA ligase [Anaerolineae bacterium]
MSQTQRLTSARIRQDFLDFFASKGHTIVPSASLVPVDDPTLLFTNAGMNQFKNIFLGLERREYTRAADTQKCMRVAGKHNDLEDVGPSPYHHTFFEMLGNWSFGDYYKKEAIAWAWELLTGVWGLPKENLYATVFEDDQGDLGVDEEVARYWQSETDINPEHISFFGRKDNFWEMGDTGPCGPCSEIHLDRGPDYCDRRGDPEHVCRVNGDCQRFVELWNLVFIQYDRHQNGELDELPAKHIDTGMGFERVVNVLQGARSNYDTDLFMPIIRRTQELVGHTDEQRDQHIVAYRVIADHGRAMTFLIGDGVLPANEGRGYVLRLLIRRAARYGRKLGFQKPFLAEIAKVVMEIMGPYFREIVDRRPFILKTITAEEERFQQTLSTGLARLDELMAELVAKGETTIAGEDAFRLYDTYGFPLDITRDVAREHGFTVDEAGYQEALEAQRARARAAAQFGSIEAEDLQVYFHVLEGLRRQGVVSEEGVGQVYDETVQLDTTVAAIIQEGKPVDAARPGEAVEIVLPLTPFYVEAGGQVSDAGFILGYVEGQEEPLWEVRVDDVRRPVPGLIVHIGEVTDGTVRRGDKAVAVVDYERRLDIMRNHTATHILHSELRYILGEHVHQAGSLVAPDRLRFDFTHSSMLTQDELDAVEQSVNDAILANYPVGVEHTSYKEAVEAGAMALFGEKYGDQVRTIKIGYPEEEFSYELCGGTHVSWTSEIGLFHILSESSVGAGIRRIEAVTGRAAQRLVQARLAELERAATFLGTQPGDVDRKVLSLLDEVQSLRKEVARLQQAVARRDFELLLDRVQNVRGVQVLAAQVDVADESIMREMTDWFRDKLGSGVIVLGAAIDRRPRLVAAVTPDLVKRGLHAGRLIQAVAQVVDGGGGGRPTMAQAGGRDLSRLPEALAMVSAWVAEKLA